MWLFVKPVSHDDKKCFLELPLWGKFSLFTFFFKKHSSKFKDEGYFISENTIKNFHFYSFFIP